jgi:hypothetical protein
MEGSSQHNLKYLAGTAEENLAKIQTVYLQIQVRKVTA